MRYLIIIAALLFLSPVMGQEDMDKPVVVTSVTIIKDIAEMIAGNEFKIDCLMPIGGDPHLHEPTPNDAILVSKASLVLVNGLTLEGWLNELINNAGGDAKVVTVTKGINAIESQTYKGSSDPHAWMDVRNGIIYADNIRNAFIELKPDAAEVFNFNFGVYKKQLEDLDNYIFKAIQSIPEQQRILITSHDAFQYYGKRYGIELESILGTSTDAEAQVSDLTRVNNVIKVSKVPAVFVESTINPKMLQQIADDNNIKIGGHLYADSIGEQGSGADSYYDMLKYNTDQIVAGLTGASNEQAKANVEIKSPSWILWAVLASLMIGGFFILSRSLSSK